MFLKDLIFLAKTSYAFYESLHDIYSRRDNIHELYNLPFQTLSKKANKDLTECEDYGKM